MNAPPRIAGNSLEAALSSSIVISPIATVLTDPRQTDNPIVCVNDAFCELTGYDQADVLGRNCRFLAGTATSARSRASLREAVTNAQPLLTEVVNYRKDGSPFRNAVMIAPVRAPDGEVHFFIGSQMDVSKQAQLPSSLQAQNAARLVASLSPRQTASARSLTGRLSQQADCPRTRDF
ncbi:PAS domain-containing protein [Variovorax sp. J22P271]|uniref:PAS domain-containing protein n=1 Tax=Variovorax davisae TaxID=3053515 RepID=UPI002577CD17|nr:PAS domain-containing protein [Variovorax sp. J22P271]MDM0036769.1 PAS domain-containing protein [Variovorax sp. J22P271]